MSQNDFQSPPEALRGPLGTVQVSELEQDRDGGDWITRLLSSGFFRHLPPENSQRFFAELHRCPVRAGEVVAAQGAQGDYLYILTHGRCAVTRRAPGSQRELKLTVLEEGDTFGEGALISGAPRTTTVRMLSDGALMRLERESFLRLVLRPTLKFLDFRDARRLIDAGGMWLDVRPQAERTDHTFDGSISIPSQLLPLKVKNLDRRRSYVIYCENGAYSAVSCFYLIRMGFDAYVLGGGLEGVCPGTRTPAVPEIVAVPTRAEHVPGPELRDAKSPAARPARKRRPLADRQHVDPVEVPTSKRNDALVPLTELHAARDHVLARQLEEVRRDAAQQLEAERKRLAHRYKKTRRKFRAARSRDASVRADLEQHCERLTHALAAAQEDLRRAKATQQALHDERSRLERQLGETSAQLMEVLSHKDEGADSARQAAAALEVVLQAMREQNDGICALREELRGRRARGDRGEKGRLARGLKRPRTV